MFDDSATLILLGKQAFAYGAMVMLGCWLALAVLFFLSRKDEILHRAAAITAILALPLGFVLARLAFALLDPNFAPLLTLKNLFKVSYGGYAFYGALAGALIAGLIGARSAGVKKSKALDLVALAVLAFLVPARLGEGFTALGVSRPLTTEFLINSFLARRDEYDAYLRTYLLEAVIAAVLLVILLKVDHKLVSEGQVFTLCCMRFGVSQTRRESLRYDGHLRYSFVGVQQVLSAALFSVTIIVLAIRLLKARPHSRLLPILALISVPVVLLAIVGVEFLIDRSELGKLFSYALYLAVLAIPVTLGILLIHQEDQLGQQRAHGAH